MHAFVIRKTPVGEYDEQVVCFTQETGKTTAVAKSILKPHSKQAMHLAILNKVEFELIQGKGMPIITGAQVATAYLPIRSSLRKMAVALFFLEVIDKLVPEHEADLRLWEFMTITFQELEKVDADKLSTLFKQRQKEMLAILGYPSETLDYEFERAADRRFDSLKFIRHVVK